MNVKTLPALGQVANTGWGGRYHQLVLSAARVSSCLLPTNLPAQAWLGTADILFRLLFSLALARSRTARFVEVSIGITPRNVRSEGVAPCKYQRLPNTKNNASKEARSATICLA